MLWPLFYALCYLATESETVDESKKSGDPDKLEHKMAGTNSDQTDESFESFSRILFQYDLGYPGHNNLMNSAEDNPFHNQQPIAGHANLTNRFSEAIRPKTPMIKTNTPVGCSYGHANLTNRFSESNLPPKAPINTPVGRSYGHANLTNRFSGSNLPPKPPINTPVGRSYGHANLTNQFSGSNLPPKPPTNTLVGRSEGHANLTNRFSESNLPPKPPANTLVGRSEGHANLTNRNLPPKPPTNTLVGRSEGHANLTNRNLSPKPPTNTPVGRSEGHANLTNRFSESNLRRRERKITIKIKGLSVERTGNSSNSSQIGKSAKMKSDNDENLPEKKFVRLNTKFKDLSVLSGTKHIASNTDRVSLPANDPKTQSDGSDEQQQQREDSSSDSDVSVFDGPTQSASSKDSDYSSDQAAAAAAAAINTKKDRKRTSSERRQKLMKQYVEMKNTGATDAQIAEQFNINKNTLVSWKTKYGIKLKKLYHFDEDESLEDKNFKLKEKNPKLSDKNEAEEQIGYSTLKRQGIKRKSSEKHSQQLSSFDSKSAHATAAEDEDDDLDKSDEEMAQKMPKDKNAQTDGRRQTRSGSSSGASGTKKF
uniref:HTH psq-type domain-containing protein n=1 Tax=Globodera rostochiensis TaxID=31243 RepID=A0A914HRD6_GLORO